MQASKFQSDKSSGLQLTPDFDRIMAQEPGSELPTHYGGRTADGETVKRPNENVKMATPRASSPAKGFDRSIPYPPKSPRRRGDWDEEQTPVDSEYREDREERPGGGLRRRPSALVTAGQASRARGSTDYERSYYGGRESERRLRARDDDDDDDGDDYDDREYASSRIRRSGSRDREGDRDGDREEWEQRHPDYETRKPPRTYQNSARQGREMVSHRTPYKPYFVETESDYKKRGDYREPDTPKAYRRRYRDQDDNDSIDGYDYGRHQPRQPLDLANMTEAERKEVLRLPWMKWMNSNAKNHFVATLGEFIGTTMFLFFAFAGTQVANIGSTASTATPSTSGTTTGGSTGFNVAVYLYIALCFGFSLMVNVWVFFRISGGLFNPAVTLAMALTGALPLVRAIFLFLAQILGGIAASAMVRFLFPTDFNVRTTLGGGTSLVQGVFIEAFLTAELIFTIFMLAKEKHKATFIAPVGIGLALFISELVGVFYTGGSLNPARSFGPCVVTATFDQEHWIYWVGPMIGTFIAVFFYKFIKMLEYEMANPGQDGDEVNDPTKNKEKAAEMRAESRQAHRFTSSAGD